MDQRNSEYSITPSAVSHLGTFPDGPEKYIITVSFLKKRSKPMLGHKWKDAISLVEVFSKDQSYCLDAKEGLDICQASTLTQASNQAATWQEGRRTLHVVLGLQYRQNSNMIKKIGLGFFSFFFKTSSLLERVSVETLFQQEK